MKPEEYRDLYNRLRYFDDIRKVHQETGLDEELLLIIYTQRFSRDITRNYYKIKANTRKMVQDWNHRQSFLEIARRYYFSPILTAYFIMLERGVTRKRFWDYVREPDTAPDKRLQKEFREIADIDMVYSPKGMEIQYARGRWGEAKLGEWLNWKRFGHRTEKDLHKKFAKTPDCLLDKPFEWNGTKIMWIESKANFGDEIEFRRNARKQLVPYTEMFGNGIVVYWFGFTNNLVPPNGVFIVDAKFFEIPKEAGGTPLKVGEGQIIGPSAMVDEGKLRTPLKQFAQKEAGLPTQVYKQQTVQAQPPQQRPQQQPQQQSYRPRTWRPRRRRPQPRRNQDKPQMGQSNPQQGKLRHEWGPDDDKKS